jgi:hypothetical protein
MAPDSPATAVGNEELTEKEPLPSCILEFEPQHFTVPSLMSAHELEPLTEIPTAPVIATD